MSGGHFNDIGYVYYKVQQFADELETEIIENNTLDEYNYSDNVITILKKQLPEIHKIAKIMRHIDYLYSGDCGEESFMERMSEVENN
jgi:hypothetical protein